MPQKQRMQTHAAMMHAYTHAPMMHAYTHAPMMHAYTHRQLRMRLAQPHCEQRQQYNTPDGHQHDRLHKILHTCMSVYVHTYMHVRTLLCM